MLNQVIIMGSVKMGFVPLHAFMLKSLFLCRERGEGGGGGGGGVIIGSDLLMTMQARPAAREAAIVSQAQTQRSFST